MTMQVRMQDPVTKEEFSFNPERCVERFYPRVVEAAIKCFMEKNWEPWYAEIFKDQGITEEVILKTLRAFSVFIDLSLDPEIKTPTDALKQAGFLDYPIAAQMAILTKVGQMCAGTFWAGVRHSVMVGVVPEPVRMMKDASVQLEALISERWSSNAAQGPQCKTPTAPTNGQSSAATSSGARAG